SSSLRYRASHPARLSRLRAQYVLGVNHETLSVNTGYNEHRLIATPPEQTKGITTWSNLCFRVMPEAVCS
ncbi:MAG TPA: hypothetical protein VKB46_04900, partial [Pyrinomonadaceae bacterium]|nr:hypothetical protein [Pyrinomonadaceae bacterium]